MDEGDRAGTGTRPEGTRPAGDARRGDRPPGPAEPLLKVRPSWWNYAGSFLLGWIVLPLVLLLFVPLLLEVLSGYVDVPTRLDALVPELVIYGLLALLFIGPPLNASIHRAALQLRVYDDRLVLEKGILAKETKELFVADVRAVDTRQRIVQRLVGTGDLLIASSGTDQYEYVVEGIPDPLDVKDLVVARRGARSGGGGWA